MPTNPQPDIDASLHAWSLRALKAGRTASAIAVAEAKLSARPSITAMMQLADLLADSGDPDAARVICLQAIRRYPLDKTVANYRLGLFAAELGEYREAARLFVSVIEDWPSNRIVAYQLASVLAHLKRFDEANAIFASGIALPCGDASKTTSAVIRFPDHQHAAQRPMPFDRAVCLNASDPDGPVGDSVDAIYFVACDFRYFELFVEPLAASLASNSCINWLLHVHLVNPTPGAVAALARLRQRNRPQVRWSSEPLDHLTERQRRTYYACARYLVLPDILRRYRRPMVVADIDQMVVRDPGSLLAGMVRYDIGLLRFPCQASNFLAVISASVMLLTPTPGAEGFCERVRDILGICSSRLNDRFAVQDGTNCPIRIGTPSCCGANDGSNASEQIGSPLGT
ncbi:MAG TPA: tetratricopeptide repeat protein, partial [Acetobacteraceae bacterium]|nr:tetratricopeptide repeat protein [Acetobacteraceae bacterium]